MRPASAALMCQSRMSTGTEPEYAMKMRPKLMRLAQSHRSQRVSESLAGAGCCPVWVALIVRSKDGRADWKRLDHREALLDQSLDEFQAQGGKDPCALGIFEVVAPVDAAVAVVIVGELGAYFERRLGDGPVQRFAQTLDRGDQIVLHDDNVGLSHRAKAGHGRGSCRSRTACCRNSCRRTCGKPR